MKFRTFAIVFVLCGCLALCGCHWVSQPGLPDTTGADVYGPPTVEIGGADDDGIGFVPWHGITTGDGTFHPNIIRGPQGGQHIWVSAHIQNLWPHKLLMSVGMHDMATGALVLPGDVTRILELTPYPTFYDYEGFIAYVSDPCAIADRPIRVTIHASDLYGVVTEDSAVITPVWSLPCGP